MSTTSLIRMIDMDPETSFIRPVLERNPDLVRSGKYILQPKVRHIFTWCDAEHACWPSPYRRTAYCDLLFLPGPRDFFLNPPIQPREAIDWSSKDSRYFWAARQRLLKNINVLRGRDFPVFIASFNLHHHSRLEWTERAYLHIALGEFEDACEIADTHEKSAMSYRREAFDVLKHELRPMLAAKDASGISEALHRYERETVRLFEIEELWERTPFPFELPEAERPDITARFTPPKRPTPRRKFVAVEYASAPRSADEESSSD